MLLRWYSSAVCKFAGSCCSRTQPIPGLPTHNSNTNCVGRYDEKSQLQSFLIAPMRLSSCLLIGQQHPISTRPQAQPCLAGDLGDRLEGKIIGLDVAVLTKQPAVEVMEVKKLHAVLVIWAAGGDWKIPAQDPPRARAPREAGAGPTKWPCFSSSEHPSCYCVHCFTALGLFLGEWLVTPVSEQAWRFVPSWEWSSAGSSGKYVSSGLSVVCVGSRSLITDRSWLEETKTRQIEADQVSDAIFFCVPVADGGFQVATCPRQLQVSPNVASSCPSIGTGKEEEGMGREEGRVWIGQRSNNWKAGPDVRKVESAQEREKKKRIEERKGTEDGKGGRGARGNLNDRSDFLWSAVGLLQVKKMAGAEHTREVEAGQAGVPGPGEDCTLHKGPCPTGSGRA
ncbi:hypothetical protein NEUTE2DRAFT_67752 [Neurospora tetrasperma FGSC 2509]|nr:hypothetical protein NEUTE2DRAFT_67752 [Neurospora tetrasperma FGSC 2509]